MKTPNARPDSQKAQSFNRLTCEHPDFVVNAMVNRLKDVGRYNVEIKVRCNVCGQPFRFLGLPMGLDFNGAAVSVTGEEGRFAIHPVGQPAPGEEGNNLPAGFRTLNRSPPPSEDEGNAVYG